MRWQRWLMATVWGIGLAANGCTSLKEVPRGEFAARPERRQVRVWTTDSLEYELDFARVQNDTLTGYRRRDVQGAVDEFDTLTLPLERVARLSARRIDWYRTGLIGGVSLAAVIAAGLSGRGSSGGPGGGGPDCPREPCQ